MKTIYKITCSANNKVYIGQTYRFEIRKREHINDLKAHRHANAYLQKDFDEYGVHNFRFDILETVDDIKANRREDYWMDFFGGINSDMLYNSTNSHTKSIFMRNKLHVLYSGKTHAELYGEEKAEIMREANRRKHLGKKATYIPFKGKVKTVENQMIAVTESLYNKVKELRSLGYTYAQISDITHIKICGIRNIVLDKIYLPFKCND